MMSTAALRLGWIGFSIGEPLPWMAKSIRATNRLFPSSFRSCSDRRFFALGSRAGHEVNPGEPSGRVSFKDGPIV